MQLGLKLTSVYRVLKFTQEAYLKPYIELNARLRANSQNDFEKNLYKLMNNCIFGKSIQNQRKQLNLKLCLNQWQANKWLIKPNYQSFTILDQNKVIIELQKQKVRLNRPIYLGFTCLEFAKYHMYDVYYNYFKKFYNEQINLVYTDTDSLLLSVKTKDFYKDLKRKFNQIMDTSNYSKNHFLYSERNTKIIGKFKDEYLNMIVHEFVGLKPKLYSILYNDDKFKQTAKGLQKSVLQKSINHQHYRNVLFDHKVYNTEMRRIQSKEHNLSTVRLTKQIFQPLDDKRYLLQNGIDSKAFGHSSIE